MTAPNKPSKPAPEPQWIADGVITRPVHIVCSPYKTGTTSVGKALVALGVGTRDMGHDAQLLQQYRPYVRKLQVLANKAKNFREFRAEHAEQLKTELAGLVLAISPYDVFHDAPYGHGQIHPFIRKVLTPEARFIWVNRDQTDWLESVRNWEETHPETYPAYTEWAADPEARAEKKRGLWKRQYRHFRRLCQFAPDHCLELDWSDLSDWTGLAEFYGMAPPEQAFPRANVSRG